MYLYFKCISQVSHLQQGVMYAPPETAILLFSHVVDYWLIYSPSLVDALRDIAQLLTHFTILRLWVNHTKSSLIPC